LRAKKKTTITHIHKIKTETKWQQLLNYRYKKKTTKIFLPLPPLYLFPFISFFSLPFLFFII
jgi:hypothetical protein